MSFRRSGWSMRRRSSRGDGADGERFARHRQRQRPSEEQRPAEPVSGSRLLAIFWSLVAVTVGGGGLMLQYIGPPTGAARLMSAMASRFASGAETLSETTHTPNATARFSSNVPSLPGVAEARTVVGDALAPVGPHMAVGSGLNEADLQRALLENDQAIKELQSRLQSFDPAAGNAPPAGTRAPDMLADRSPEAPPAIAERDVDAVTEQLAQRQASSAELECKLAQGKEALPQFDHDTAIPSQQLADLNKQIDIAHAQEVNTRSAAVAASRNRAATELASAATRRWSCRSRGGTGRAGLDDRSARSCGVARVALDSLVVVSADWHALVASEIDVAPGVVPEPAGERRVAPNHERGRAAYHLVQHRHALVVQRDHEGLAGDARVRFEMRQDDAQHFDRA